MSSTWLEQTRSTLEMLELIDHSITTELMLKSDNNKESVMIDHRIKNLIDYKQNKCLDSLILLNDSDGLKKEEMQILIGQKSVVGQGNRNPDIWFNFYERLKEIREYHKKYNNAVPNPVNSVEQIRDHVFQAPYKEPFFTGEETQGKFVDMNELYHQFINLKGIGEVYKIREEQNKIMDYLWYLQNFDEFHEIPINYKDKNYKKFKRYLENLVNYLREFFQRVQPLTDFSIVEKQINEDFEFRWKEGTLRGWEKRTDELEDLEDNPLYCQYCKKLFTNEHTFVHHLTGKLHIKNEKMIKMGQQSVQKKQINGNGNSSQNKKQIEENLGGPAKAGNKQTPEDLSQELEQQQDGKKNFLDSAENRKKTMAYLESYAVRMKELLGDLIHDTINQIRKKQSRTYDEMVAENVIAKEVEEASSESEDDEPVYNPKNLPLGWDGKPIPYWLYKLHGLGIEYKCEICGNYSYWGRRAFERHFQEWRHAYGMKCLKIPNTIHFKEITSINDALALHQKLLMESELSQFKPDIEEEFEDSEGNLLNKKSYNDLKKQGLL